MKQVDCLLYNYRQIAANVKAIRPLRLFVRVRIVTRWVEFGVCRLHDNSGPGQEKSAGANLAIAVIVTHYSVGCRLRGGAWRLLGSSSRISAAANCALVRSSRSLCRLPLKCFTFFRLNRYSRQGVSGQAPSAVGRLLLLLLLRAFRVSLCNLDTACYLDTLDISR